MRQLFVWNATGRSAGQALRDKYPSGCAWRRQAERKGSIGRDRIHQSKDGWLRRSVQLIQAIHVEETTLQVTHKMLQQQGHLLGDMSGLKRLSDYNRLLRGEPEGELKDFHSQQLSVNATGKAN